MGIAGFLGWRNKRGGDERIATRIL